MSMFAYTRRLTKRLEGIMVKSLGVTSWFPSAFGGILCKDVQVVFSVLYPLINNYSLPCPKLSYHFKTGCQSLSPRARRSWSFRAARRMARRENADGGCFFAEDLNDGVIKIFCRRAASRGRVSWTGCLTLRAVLGIFFDKHTCSHCSTGFPASKSYGKCMLFHQALQAIV